jgi:hypothetical protein
MVLKLENHSSFSSRTLLMYVKLQRCKPYLNAHNFCNLCLQLGILNSHLSVCTFPEAVKMCSYAFLFSVITTVVVIMIPVLTIVNLLHMITISITCSCGYPISVFALLSPFTSEGCASAEILLVTVVISDFYESLI